MNSGPMLKGVQVDLGAGGYAPGNGGLIFLALADETMNTGDQPEMGIPSR
jgi:hypothetical protein